MDVLRAGHVAILDGAFQYFCGAECKDAFVEVTSRRSALDAETASPPVVSTLREKSAGEPEALASGPRPAPSARADAPDAGDAGDEVDAPDAPYFPDAHPPAAAREGEPSAAPSEDRGEPEPEPREAAPVTLRSRARERAEARVRERDAEAADTPSPDAPREVAGADPAARAPRDLLGWLALAGIGVGALGAVIGLAGPEATRARFWLALVAVACVMAHGASSRDGRPWLSRLLSYAPAVVAVAVAVAARVLSRPSGAYEVHACVMAAATLVCALLISRVARGFQGVRASVSAGLVAPAFRVVGQEIVEARAEDIKPGEEVVVGAGETCPVDGVVVAGSADVLPWLGATASRPVIEGQPIVAGARVVEGKLRIAATATGDERAWLATVSASAVDTAPTILLARRVVERGAPIAALLVGAAVYATNAKALDVVAALSAGGFAAGAAVAVAAAAAAQAHARAAALARGIVYRGAAAFEDAGRIDVAVLCSRGTVLVGEPEIVGMETFGAPTALEMLALAAGAETASSHPLAAAVLRAARARGVEPEAVRSATNHPGLGVTALAPSGKRLVLGSRAFLLREGVSVAAAESKVAALEGRGKTVLLLALGGKLMGFMALQDGVRRGARAAVQKLHDAHIEPVLLSGDSRQTCEATAQALDVEHVRPEVPASERGTEVRALADSGRAVAAIGHPPTDDGALGASTVAVAMRAAGGIGEWAVQLASDDVRDAALGLTLARSARDRARLALLVGAVSTVAPALVVGFAVAPPVLLPLVAAAGAVAALVASRSPAETL